MAPLWGKKDVKPPPSRRSKSDSNRRFHSTYIATATVHIPAKDDASRQDHGEGEILSAVSEDSAQQEQAWLIQREPQTNQVTNSLPTVSESHGQQTVLHNKTLPSNRENQRNKSNGQEFVHKSSQISPPVNQDNSLLPIDGEQRQSAESSQVNTNTEGSIAREGTDQLSHDIHTLQANFPSIPLEHKIPSSSSPQHVKIAMDNIVSAYQNACDYIDGLEKAASKRETDYRNLQVTLQETAKNKENLHKRISVLEIELDKKSGALEVLEKQARNAEKNHYAVIKEIRECHSSEKEKFHESAEAKLKQLEGEFQAERQKLKRQMTEAEKQYSDSGRELRRSYEDQLVSRERIADGEISRVKAVLENQLELATQSLRTLKLKYENELQRQRQQMDEKLESAKESLENETTTYRKKIEYLKESHELEMNSQMEQLRMERQAHRRELEELKSIHNLKTEENLRTAKEQLEIEKKSRQREIEKLIEDHKSDLYVSLRAYREEFEALKGTLVKRDHRSSAISDQELSVRFQEITNDVDAFSRLEWEREREASWPFPAISLRNSNNLQRTKQYIIQNNLWTILYEKIFYTPFRMLGGKGKALERQWVEKYGKDHKSTGALALCPGVTKAAEKWRCEEINKCSDAISKPLMYWDPNYNIKRDYELLLEETSKEVCQELERVTQLGSDEKQRLRTLVMKAARLWLEVGQQRCRIFLLVSNSVGYTARASSLSTLQNNGLLSVVIVPELRRFGNTEGENLDREELVADCEGKLKVLKLS